MYYFPPNYPSFYPEHPLYLPYHPSMHFYQEPFLQSPFQQLPNKSTQQHHMVEPKIEVIPRVEEYCKQQPPLSEPNQPNEKQGDEKIDENELKKQNKKMKKEKDRQSTAKSQEREKSLYEGQFMYLSNFKKNTQSNIVNQVFSYVGCKIKSQKFISRLLGGDLTKIRSYYEFIKTLKKRKKKYINRKYILDLCILDENTHAGYKLYIRQKGYKNTLSIEELRLVLRKMFFHYLKSECILCIATSKKLSSQAWKEHLFRRRQLIEYLLYNIQQISSSY